MPAENEGNPARHGNGDSVNRHPVSFENLADWLEGRLDPSKQQAVEEHLARGCRTCEGDLRWLRRVTAAFRPAIAADPPPELVARAKALYGPGQRRAAPQLRVWSLFGLPRLAMAGAALSLVLLGVAVVLTVTPGAFAGTATLTSVQGIAEQRGAGGAWELVERGATLQSGDSLRVSGGTAVLTLFDGSTAELQSGAELTLSTLRSGLLRVAVQVTIGQQEGEVTYDVTALHSPASSFQVRSPAALVTVRGTRFALTVQNKQETKVEVFEGKVEVANELASQMLTQSQVAVVPARAPLIHLPTLTPAPKPTRTPTRMLRPSPSSTSAPPTAESTMAPVATAQAEGPRDTPMPAPTDTPTEAPTDAPTQTATAEPSSTEAPSPTATATSTAEPDDTPFPNPVEFEGLIERLPPSGLGVWLIGGRLVLVKANTEIVGRPEVGLLAKVRGWKHQLRPLEAIRIGIEERQPSRTRVPWSTEPQPTPTAPEGPTSTARSPPVSTPWSAQTPPTRVPRPTWTPRPARTPPKTPAVVITHGPTPTMTCTPTAFPQESHSLSNAR